MSTAVATPPALTDASGVINDVTQDECTTDGDSLTATGSVVNSSDAARDIVITASWTGTGDQVVASGNQTIKQLAPGASARYSIMAVASAEGGDKLTCVVGAQAGTLSE